MEIFCLSMNTFLYSKRNNQLTMNQRRQGKMELFLELACPDANGFSRWVDVNEFVGRYKELSLGNGFSWGRKSSTLAKKYNVVTDKSRTPGNSVDRIKLDGFNKTTSFQQAIRKDISEAIRQKRCVMLGVNGNSVNTIIEVDHKDGRKNDLRVSNMSTQRLEDFQPLCKAANDIKRQICKRCAESDKRWNARNIEGNPYDFYEGGEDYCGTCEGCYQYDPVEYRIRSARRLVEESSRHTAQFIMEKLYPSTIKRK